MADTFKPDLDALAQRGRETQEALDRRLRERVGEAERQALYDLLSELNEDPLRAMLFASLSEDAGALAARGTDDGTHTR